MRHMLERAKPKGFPTKFRGLGVLAFGVAVLVFRVSGVQRLSFGAQGLAFRVGVSGFACLVT